MSGVVDNMPNPVDKRKHKRLDCLVPVDGQDGGVFEETRTVDISKRGIGIISKHKIPLNQEIPIELDLDEDGEPVLVIGQVMWVTPIDNTENYRVGVVFKDILHGSKTRLEKYFGAS